jgi:hypothetical protein
LNFFDIFSTGTKGKKLNFYSSNINNSHLVPILNPKSDTFLPLVPGFSTQINQKNSKKVFLAIFSGPKTWFLDPNNFFKNLLAAFGIWYNLQKN